MFRFLHKNIAIGLFILGSFFICSSSTRIDFPKSGGSALGIPTHTWPGSQKSVTAAVLLTIEPKYSALPVTEFGWNIVSSSQRSRRLDSM